MCAGFLKYLSRAKFSIEVLVKRIGKFINSYRHITSSSLTVVAFVIKK